MKDLEYIKKNISGQNVQQAKGKLRRLTRIVQAIEQVGMEAVMSQSWSQLDVETTTSPFSVDEAERRVRSLRPPRRVTPDLHLHLHSAGRSGDLVIRTVDLEIGYPDRMLFRRAGHRVAPHRLRGADRPERRGKSTFLKTILGQLEPRARPADPRRESSHRIFRAGA